jgi:RHS repeat-associated protein
MPLKVRYTTIGGEIVSENRVGVERDYLPDPLGLTVALLNSAQAKTDTFTYWPYGEVKTRTGTTGTPFQFVGTRGYYRDSSTKTYVRARYLDVQKGRWVTTDPMWYYSDLNRFAYVGSNPMSLIDLAGLFWNDKPAPGPVPPSPKPAPQPKLKKRDHSTYYCCNKVVTVVPGIGLPVRHFGHCFISTNKCGSFGFHPIPGSNNGRLTCDDDRLEPMPGNPVDSRSGLPIHIPGRGRRGPGKTVTSCIKLSDDPAFEDSLCDCARDFNKRGPQPFSVWCGDICWTVAAKAIECAYISAAMSKWTFPCDDPGTFRAPGLVWRDYGTAF